MPRLCVSVCHRSRPVVIRIQTIFNKRPSSQSLVLSRRLQGFWQFVAVLDKVLQPRPALAVKDRRVRHQKWELPRRSLQASEL